MYYVRTLQLFYVFVFCFDIFITNVYYNYMSIKRVFCIDIMGSNH